MACGGPETRASILLLVLVMCLVHAAAQLVTMDHRVLLLSRPGTPVDFLTKVMDAYGIPYDVLNYDASADQPVSFGDLLTKPDGNGAYSAMVLYPSWDLLGYMTEVQVQELRGYQATTGARLLRMGVWPWNFGYDATGCSSDEGTATFTPAATMGISGVKPGISLNMNGLYRCGATIPAARTTCPMWASDFAATGIFEDCTSEVVLAYDPASTLGTDFAETSMGAAVVTYTSAAYNGTRQELVTTFDCGAWQPSCLVFAHYALSWLLHDIIPGQRQALLSLQVDDVFVSTTLRDSDVNFRAGPVELAAHAAWQQGLPAALGLPDGSNIKLELAFNGNGLLEASALPQELVVEVSACSYLDDYVQLGCSCFSGLTTYNTCTSTEPFCKNCTKDWPMPLDSGSNLVDPTYSSTAWSRSDITSGDALADALFSNPTLRKSFFWVSHTFTHQILNNATYSDARLQWSLNQDMANLLGFTDELSTKTVVTPGISGMFNGNNLRALVDLGYVAATGDNTWAGLFVNQDSLYHMRRTTSTSSNFPGFLIIPRWATEIYFDVAQVAQEMSLYNKLYSSFFNGNSTLDQVLSREANLVVYQALLTLRHDPHMMHQANLALLDGPKSLIMLWTEAVLQKLASYVSWPVTTLKFDDLLATYLQREQRDACKLSYTLDIDTGSGTVTGVTATASAGSGTCQAPLMVPSNAALTGENIMKGPGAGSGVGTKILSVPSAGGSRRFAANNLAW